MRRMANTVLVQRDSDMRSSAIRLSVEGERALYAMVAQGTDPPEHVMPFYLGGVGAAPPRRDAKPFRIPSYESHQTSLILGDRLSDLR